MTKQDTPFYPSEKLVAEWICEWNKLIEQHLLTGFPSDPDLCSFMTKKAADWQLEIAVEWAENYAGCGELLRNHMRPKPKSLAEAAIQEWTALVRHTKLTNWDFPPTSILPALQRLKELEAKK